MIQKDAKFATEEWRSLPGLESTHQVSNLGRIRRIKAAGGCPAGRVLKPATNHKGYLCFRLTCEGEVYNLTAHGAVCAAFIGPRPNGATINHKDGDKTNNAPNNLEYATHYENFLHAVANGLRSNGIPKLTHQQVRELRSLKGTATSDQLATRFGVSGGTVRSLWLGLTWKHVL
ncbi:NUMOD4 motif-containing HNH endonuclease [Gemmata obscuriglobus]|uniref:HNH nuclease domain-containing protein n=1 Tax=Gemmata obscuriglobus TaxID=114 RepID=A0A2Z3GYD1_9BACT|nr:hypothetical protein C1280_08475 [Gemmata obscuriglobus]